MKRLLVAALMASCSVAAVSAQGLPTTPGTPQPTTRPGPSSDGIDPTAPTTAPGDVVRDEASEAARDAGQAVDDAADAAAKAAGDAATATGEAVGGAAEATGEAASDAAEAVDEATTEFNQLFIDGVPPLRGANSFTETQVKNRIEGYGFTNVQGLALSDDGVWRATVDGKDKQPLPVAFDFQGNLTLIPSDSLMAGNPAAAEGDTDEDASAAEADAMPGSAGAGGRTGVDDEGQSAGGSGATPTRSQGKSYTEQEIRTRLETYGFSELQNLTADDQKVWRADAKYNDQDVDVLADGRGFITILN